MKNNFVKKEYISHLKRNFGKLFSLALVFLIIIVIFIPFLNSFSNQYYRNNKTLKSLNYDYVVESNNFINYNNTFYQLNDIAIISHNNKTQNVTVVAQTDSGYTLNNLKNKLKEHEIIISKQVANKLKVKEYDYIQINLGLWEESKTFKVVQIINYLNGFYVDENENFPLVFVSNDNDLIKNTKGRYISLLSTNEKEKFILDNGSYLNIYSKQDSIKYLTTKEILLSLIPVVFELIVSVAFIYIINKFLNKESKKYFKNGFNPKEITKIKITDIMLFVIVPLILQLIIIIFSTLIFNMTLLPVLVCWLVILNVQIVILIGDKRYEKVNRI